MTTATPRRKASFTAGLPAALLAAALGGAALPAGATFTAASSASEGVSASAGSVSTSFETSSDSSKGETKAAGDYRVIDVAAAADRPGMLRMALEPVAPDGAPVVAETAPATDAALAGTDAARKPFAMFLPVQALQATPIAVGDVISAKPRPYGIEFARADTGRAFFLVLQDEWHRELQTRALTL